MVEGPIDPTELNKRLYTQREWENFGMRLQWRVEDAQKELEVAKKSVRVPAVGAFVASPVTVGASLFTEVVTDHFSWLSLGLGVTGIITFFMCSFGYMETMKKAGKTTSYEGSAKQLLDHARRSYNAWLMADATHNEEFKREPTHEPGPSVKGITEVVRTCKVCGDSTDGSPGWCNDWRKAHMNSTGHRTYVDRNTINDALD